MTALACAVAAAFLGGWRYGLWCARQRIRAAQARARRDRALAHAALPATFTVASPTPFNRWHSWN